MAFETLLDSLDKVKSKINELKRNSKFKKARLTRQEAVELQHVLGECRGKVEVCQKDFARAVNEQSRNIVAGLKMGADVSIQEQILWDAAIGYMLVRDAIYALSTINNYDAVSHAYDLLDTAMKQISKKKEAFPKKMSIGSTGERNAYGYLTSSTSLQDKEELLESFFGVLRIEGDIERHLTQALNSPSRAAQVAHTVAQPTTPPSPQSPAGGSTSAALTDRLNRVKDDAGTGKPLQLRDSIGDIDVPKTSE